MVFIYLIAGLVLLLVGANYLVEGSVSLARRAGISSFVIGVTVVGFGTSAPELLVSVSSAIQGHGDLSVGNIIGSGICNVLLVLGATAAICPFYISRETLRRDIPVNFFVSVLLVALIFSGYLFGNSGMGLNRIDALILLCCLVVYMWKIFSTGEVDGEKKDAENVVEDSHSVWFRVVQALVSLAALIYGSQLLVDSASELALQMGISEKVVAISIVAVGTSLPELTTCIIAALKGDAELALGNALGSNVLNILFILGVSALCRPITLVSMSAVDCGMLLLSALLAFAVSFTFGRYRFDRIEGIIFLLIYAGYMGYLAMGV